MPKRKDKVNDALDTLGKIIFGLFIAIFFIFKSCIKTILEIIEFIQKKKLEKNNKKLELEYIKIQQKEIEEKEKYDNIENEFEKIDNMEGNEFENYIIEILKENDYTGIEGTAYTGDYGVDIIAYKNNLKCAIQCKRYSDKVSVNAIQEIVAGRKHYKCDKAIVITNNYYTRNAKELANTNKVELLDRDDIIIMIKKNYNNLKVNDSRMPDSDLSTIIEKNKFNYIFEPKEMAAGLEYYEKDNVKIIAEDNDKYLAIIYDNDSYNTEISLNEYNITNLNCSCQNLKNSKYICKHSFSLLLKISELKYKK